MQPIHVKTRQTEIAVDSITPVQAYARLRDTVARSLLFECNTSNGEEDNHSYVCLEPLIELSATPYQLNCITPQQKEEIRYTKENDFVDLYTQFLAQLHIEGFQSVHNGLFGHTSFEAYELKKPLTKRTPTHTDVVFTYALFRFVLVFDPNRHKLYLIENCLAEESFQSSFILDRLSDNAVLDFPFELQTMPKPSVADHYLSDAIKQAIDHCKRGDTFQLVLSRNYSAEFQGDDFQVYRQLRALNPSPYLFYFDYGNYRLLGSSPELQLSVDNKTARVKPIAGTCPRTVELAEDHLAIQQLMDDPKENAEHVMLVDLARNDLGIDTKNIVVEAFKTIESYSHVHHMVSSVRGDIPDTTTSIEVFLSTFPAGTLTGAPKAKALELIQQYEATPRGWYGGAVGFFGLNGNIRQAITIRTLLSQNNRLHYQAGAGIVAVSNIQREMAEMQQKLEALFLATRQASNSTEHIL
jgi:anthranilate synthase component 1